MHTIIFAGPSLESIQVPQGLEGRIFPPVRCGDVYKAVKAGSVCIGIIDGVFEQERAVWHKEILWALSRGVRIFGAASMGALRAVELAPYGMTGIGRIFRWYRDGVINDDGEVAVLHAPADIAYRSLTEPLVNVRASVQSAENKAVFTAADSAWILETAASIHYKERTRLSLWAALRSAPDATIQAGNPSPMEAKLDWLDTHWVDQKRIDAEELLSTLSHLSDDNSADIVDFEFGETVFWQDFKAEMDAE